MVTRFFSIIGIIFLLLSCISTGKSIPPLELGDLKPITTQTGLVINITSITTGISQVVSGNQIFSPKKAGTVITTVNISITNNTEKQVKQFPMNDLELIVELKNGDFTICSNPSNRETMAEFGIFSFKTLEPTETCNYSLVYLNEKDAVIRAISYGRTDFVIIKTDKEEIAGNSFSDYITRLKNIEKLMTICTDAPFDVVNKFIKENGLDYEVRNKIGLTPFMASAFFGNVNLGKGLLKNGVDKHATLFYLVDEIEAIHLASLNGQANFVEMLVKNGIDRDTKSSNGETPIIFAIRNNQLLVLKKLILLGCDINEVKIPMAYSKEMSPIKYTKQRKFTAMVEYLQSIGCTE